MRVVERGGTPHKLITLLTQRAILFNPFVYVSQLSLPF
jgi:hypothetical protein